MKKLFALLLLLTVLFTSCAEPAAVEIQMPSDPYTPLYVSSLKERDEDGMYIYRVYREHLKIRPWEYDGAKDPTKPHIISGTMAETAGPSLDLYAASSDLIVVGTVVADSQEVPCSIWRKRPQDEVLNKEMDDGLVPLEGTYYHHIVPETVLWQIDAEKELGETIDIYQSSSEIQMKKGDKVVCLLSDRGENGWVGVCFEHAIFKVTEDGHMYSFSDFMDLSKYDTFTLEEFKALLIDYIQEYHYAISYSEYCKAKES